MTEEEKQKILEEEEYRQKIIEREEYRSSIQNKTALSPQNKGTNWTGMLKFILIFMIIFTPILFISVNLGNTYREQELSNMGLGTSILDSTIPTTRGSSINVSRQKIIQAMDTYVFKKQPEFKQGQENYEAKNSVSEIQLLGPVDNLDSASFAVYLTKGTVDERVEAMSDMVFFGASVDEACSEWFIKQFKYMDPDKTKIYSNTEVACNRTLSFFWFPGDTFTFSIQPK